MSVHRGGPDAEVAADLADLFGRMDEAGRGRAVETAAAADEAADMERLMQMSDEELEGYVDQKLSR